MQVLSPGLNLSDFLERIPIVKERVLMLDYNGTLAPFQVRLERASPYPGVTEALRDLMDAGGTRVVIVSGRRAEDLVPLLALVKHPEIWGGHGWERLLPDGRLRVQEPSPAEMRVLEQAMQMAQELLRAGARVERKPGSIALHWRGLPALAVARIQERARASWSTLAQGDALDLLAFDGGIELRAKGCNKQHAIKAVLSETGPDSAIAYLGDDITDEDAFVAVKPRGVAVLVRPQFRETAADVWIRPPRELLAFVRHWRVKGSKS
ncbi:MAG: trehalose-phosphatase [Betaproteobacteria bacterium RIFCSPLOWO2_12_FULL_62_58]|nr:MAG: trehalose-phosphatase [Betaproteobacteria bacterium RIFCSPLOWO2_12_FULL_62_58]